MAFVALGWTVRYFLVFQSNYLGSFTGFSTLYEYLEKRKRNLPVGDLLELKYREGKVWIPSVCLRASNPSLDEYVTS